MYLQHEPVSHLTLPQPTVTSDPILSRKRREEQEQARRQTAHNRNYCVHTLTLLVWPIRWQRAWAWTSFWMALHVTVESPTKASDMNKKKSNRVR